MNRINSIQQLNLKKEKEKNDSNLLGYEIEEIRVSFRISKRIKLDNDLQTTARPLYPNQTQKIKIPLRQIRRLQDSILKKKTPYINKHPKEFPKSKRKKIKKKFLKSKTKEDLYTLFPGEKENKEERKKKIFKLGTNKSH